MSTSFRQRCVYPLAITFSLMAAPPSPKPPETRAEPVREVIHGVSIADPYRWLEDQNSPQTRAWIDAQNEYTERLMASRPGKDAIEKRVLELMKTDSAAIPIEAGGRLFFTRKAADQELPVLYMRQGVDGKDEVLVDPHPLSPDRTTSVDIQGLSDDGLLLAYGVRQGGEDEVVVRLLDIESRKIVEEMPRERYLEFWFEPGRKGFYYGVMTPAGPRVRHHKMGTGRSEDAEVFGEGYGLEFWISLQGSKDGRYLLFRVSQGWDKDDLFLLGPGDKKPKLISGDGKASYAPRIAGKSVFLSTDWKASRRRVMAFDLEKPEREHWREVVPEGPSSIEAFEVSGGKLLVHTLENAISRVRVYDANGKAAGEVKFPSAGTAESITGRWESKDAFVAFTSFSVPKTIYYYDSASGRQSEWHRTEVPIRSEDFEVEQVWYKSKDGTRIPMFLVHKKGFRKDGTAPTLLYGYGGFNVSLTPEFSPLTQVWLEHGGLFAVPNLRGGGEFGEAWHQAGMLSKKQNVFDDFLAAAEWLIAEGYTKPSKLAIRGGSNGGLLVGAAMTQRPDLFRAVICGVPLLDMLRYQKFLLGKLWVPEYGSAEDPDQFRYLYAYSPYQHVKKGEKYPAVLLVTGDADTRVAPLHARKMTALLQASSGSDYPVMLRYDTKFGHSRALPVTKRAADLTQDLQFLFWQLGMEE